MATDWRPTWRGLGALPLTLAVALGLAGVLLGAAPAAAQSPVLIGATISQSGPLARAAKAQLTAYQLAEEITNQEGGLLGRPVKLVLYDDQSNASNGVTLYRRLIFQDKVDLLLGPFSSGVTFAVAPIIEQARIPVLAPQAADPKIWEGGRRYLFQVLPHGYSYLAGAVDLAARHGLKKLGIVNLENAMAIASAEGVRRRAKELGLTIVMDESYASDTSDFTAIMSKAKRLGVEAILGGGFINDEIALTKAAKSVGYSPRLMMWQIGASDPNFRRELGEDGDYVGGNTNWETFFQTPGNQEFVKRYTAKFGEAPYYDTAASYAAFRLLVEAVRKVGKLDREAIRDWLSKTRTTTVFGEYEVNEGGAQVGKKSAMFQWQKGAKVIIWPDGLKMGDPVMPDDFWKKK
jgi:branched-chain amino acid transport system substrate-binding protein